MIELTITESLFLEEVLTNTSIALEEEIYDDIEPVAISEALTLIKSLNYTYEMEMSK